MASSDDNEEQHIQRDNEDEDSNSSHSGEDYEHAFDKSQYEGKKGHLLLQLQKSYKGDSRFKLLGKEHAGFDIDLKQAKKHLPQSMLGALSKREETMLFREENSDEDDMKSKKKKRNAYDAKVETLEGAGD